MDKTDAHGNFVPSHKHDPSNLDKTQQSIHDRLGVTPDEDSGSPEKTDRPLKSYPFNR